VKKKTSRHRQKGKNMKLEEVNLKTKEAVDYLVQSLEGGQSAVLRKTDRLRASRQPLYTLLRLQRRDTFLTPVAGE
jgi:hypothetical protein